MTMPAGVQLLEYISCLPVSNGGAWLSKQSISFLFVWPMAWHFNKLHNTDDFFIALRGHSVQQTSGEVVRPTMKTQE